LNELALYIIRVTEVGNLWSRLWIVSCFEWRHCLMVKVTFSVSDLKCIHICKTSFVSSHLTAKLLQRIESTISFSLSCNFFSLSFLALLFCLRLYLCVFIFPMGLRNKFFNLKLKLHFIHPFTSLTCTTLQYVRISLLDLTLPDTILLQNPTEILSVPKQRFAITFSRFWRIGCFRFKNFFDVTIKLL
jgi:hypothetical protein